MQSLFAPQPNPSRLRSWKFWLIVQCPILLIIVVSILFTRTRNLTAKAEHEVEVFRAAVPTNSTLLIQHGQQRVAAGSTRICSPNAWRPSMTRCSDCRPSRPRSFFAKAGPAASSVRLPVHRTDCAKGVLQETFGYLIVGDEAQLAQYDASSAF